MLKDYVSRVKDESLSTVLIIINGVLNTHADEIDGMGERLRKLEDKNISDDKELKIILDNIEKESENRKWFMRIIVGGIVTAIIGYVMTQIGIQK